MTDKPKGGRGKIEHDRNAAVVADRKAGMTYPEMGEKYGLSRSRLVKIIKTGTVFSSIKSMMASLRDES